MTNPHTLVLSHFQWKIRSSKSEAAMQQMLRNVSFWMGFLPHLYKYYLGWLPYPSYCSKGNGNHHRDLYRFVIKLIFRVSCWLFLTDLGAGCFKTTHWSGICTCREFSDCDFIVQIRPRANSQRQRSGSMRALFYELYYGHNIWCIFELFISSVIVVFVESLWMDIDENVGRLWRSHWDQTMDNPID